MPRGSEKRGHRQSDEEIRKLKRQKGSLARGVFAGTPESRPRGRRKNMDRAKLVNIPNLLTLVRILLVPVFVILYFELPLARWGR